jgi:hypothetical protein
MKFENKDIWVQLIIFFFFENNIVHWANVPSYRHGQSSVVRIKNNATIWCKFCNQCKNLSLRERCLPRFSWRIKTAVDRGSYPTLVSSKERYHDRIFWDARIQSREVGSERNHTRNHGQFPLVKWCEQRSRTRTKLNRSRWKSWSIVRVILVWMLGSTKWRTQPEFGGK